jgi:hypothetical protein
MGRRWQLMTRHSSVAFSARETACFLRQEFEHVRTSFHRMNDQFIPAVEHEDDCLEQPTLGIKTQSKLARWTVIIEIFIHTGQEAT